MSDAEKLRRALEAELKKPIPDKEVVYAIKQRLPYANMIDTAKLQRGDRKLDRLLKESK